MKNFTDADLIIFKFGWGQFNSKLLIKIELKLLSKWS